jgi:hypothetical protein
VRTFSYTESRQINKPVVFSFSPVSYNTMLLIPPSTEPDTRPLCTISVALDCFNPTASVTTVRLGGSAEHGEIMGEFEMGISAAPGMVTIGEKRLRLSQVLKKEGRRHDPSGRWMWEFGTGPRAGPRLTWVWVSNVYTVRSSPVSLLFPVYLDTSSS